MLTKIEQAGLTIGPRVMVVNQWGRTLCTSWIDPMGVEVDLGFFNDPLEKFRVVEIERQDLPGTALRRKPNWAKTDEEVSVCWEVLLFEFFSRSFASGGALFWFVLLGRSLLGIGVTSLDWTL